MCCPIFGLEHRCVVQYLVLKSIVNKKMSNIMLNPRLLDDNSLDLYDLFFLNYLDNMCCPIFGLEILLIKKCVNYV